MSQAILQWHHKNPAKCFCQDLFQYKHTQQGRSVADQRRVLSIGLVEKPAFALDLVNELDVLSCRLQVCHKL